MKTFVAFFEIPAVNMERAVQFYGTVFGENWRLSNTGKRRWLLFLPVISNRSAVFLI